MQLPESLQFPETTLSEDFWLFKKVNFRGQISEHIFALVELFVYTDWNVQDSHKK